MVYNVQSLCLFVVLIIVVYSPYSYAPTQSLWNGLTRNRPFYGVKAPCEAWLHFEGLTDNIMTGEGSNMARAIARDKYYDTYKHVWAACYAYFISSFATSIPELWSLKGYCQKVNPGDGLTDYVTLKSSKMTCAEWLNVYGFHNENEFNTDNAYMALHRVLVNDNVPHFLVTIYSRYLSKQLKELITKNPPHPDFPMNYNNDLLAPPVFCVLLENPMIIEAADIPFVTLDTVKRCHEWIVLSGYSHDDVIYNVYKAIQQNDDIKEYHSLWTIKYINYILKKVNEIEQLITDEYPFEKAIADLRVVPPAIFCNMNNYFQQVYYD